jgi:deoxyribonucleoside regulator
MSSADKRIERMVTIARMYYEQDMTQNEIAKAMGISRPLVSILLSEAKTCGIVTFQIHDVANAQQLMVNQMQQRFSGIQFHIVPDESSSDATDNLLAKTAFQYCFRRLPNVKNIGIGWGSMLSRMTSVIDETLTHSDQTVFPLVGGIRSSYRGYHTNEIVRMIGEKTGSDVHYLYFPAFFDETADLEYIKGMEDFQFINQLWNEMDVALISISNYPSYPDVGVKYRFGNDLMKKNAVGRLLAYYYDIHGNLIDPWINGAMQPDMQQLRNSSQVVAVCSTQLRPECVIGALCTNVIKTILMPESLAKKVVQMLTTE